MQVISIDENGAMECLRAKEGQGIDLRVFGNVKVERVSEILFDDIEQRFYVSFLKGDLAGRKLTHAIYSHATGKPSLQPEGKPVMFFTTYEEGVAHEVEVLDAIRENPIKWSEDLFTSLEEEAARGAAQATYFSQFPENTAA